MKCTPCHCCTTRANGWVLFVNESCYRRRKKLPVFCAFSHSARGLQTRTGVQCCSWLRSLCPGGWEGTDTCRIVKNYWANGLVRPIRVTELLEETSSLFFLHRLFSMLQSRVTASSRFFHWWGLHSTIPLCCNS